MVQLKSRFLHLKRVDGTTLEFVSGAFRVCKFQSGLLAKYFILANNCSWSHTNFGQTGGDLSFRVPYLFQIHWPHGGFHQKMRSRNLQFLCSLWQLGCFLNVNFSSFKTPPALHSVAKCFAASTQHWCLWNNETSKTAGLCIGVEAYFYGWCNADPDFGIWSEEMAQLKTLCLVLSGSVNSKAAYWPNTSSWQIIAAGHTQTSARLGEISHFEFHICFKYIGHMASSTKKCDHETSSFCVVFGSLGFFLTSTFPALKHHQACILLQSASQLQLSIGAFGKTKLQKLLVWVLESRLISMDGATQIQISAFEASRWHNSWVCVWCFQGL